MAIKSSKLRKILVQKLGGVEYPKKRHECYRVYIDDQLVAQTFMSRKKGNTIGDTLLRRMADQLNVNLREFKLFCACNIDRDTFLQLILDDPGHS